MITEKMKFGFIKDENNFKLNEVLKDNAKLKEVHIDIYPENPLATSSTSFMLLLRAIENNVIIENNNDRLIIKRNDKFKTYIMNVLLSNISECFYEDLGSHLEFILNIQNIYYRLTILN